MLKLLTFGNRSATPVSRWQACRWQKKWESRDHTFSPRPSRNPGKCCVGHGSTSLRGAIRSIYGLGSTRHDLAAYPSKPGEPDKGSPVFFLPFLVLFNFNGIQKFPRNA